MYKKQMIFQKVICLMSIAGSVLVFLYSLGIMTDLYDSLYTTMRNVADLSQTTVEGSIIYYDMQGFNRNFVKAGVALILLGCFLVITNTHKRRKYYGGNYAAVALYAVAQLGVAVWAHFEISAYKAQYLQLDFEALKQHSEMWQTPYIESTFWFDVHYLVFAIALLITIGLAWNTIWKTKLMKEEQALIDAGKEVTA